MAAIDLNADMGEYASDAERTIEAALMPLITSCSIACGGHAGDAGTMQTTARLAKLHGVRIGAHPSYPDRENFGRRSRSFDEAALLASMKMQIEQLRTVLAAESMPLTHLKPHGALYNDAAKNISLARLVASLASGATLIGPPDSQLEAAAKEKNIAFAREGFVDRLYLASGALSPRSEPGAVLPDIRARAQQALKIATGAEITAADGAVTVVADTLCIHSDSHGAVETAQAVRSALKTAEIDIRPFA